MRHIFLSVACLLMLVLLSQQSFAREQQSGMVVGIDDVHRHLKGELVLAEGAYLRDASPDQLDAIFMNARVSTLPRSLKISALGLAGQGKTFSFQQPSDIFDKVSHWFSEGREASKTAGDAPPATALGLSGPGPEWSAESTAFISLWRCMPRVPFSSLSAQPTLDTKRKLVYAGYDEFSDCMDHFGFSRKSLTWTDTQRLDLAKASQKYLSVQFDQFLTKHACAAQGVDDCVFILLLWSALTPYDHKLARHIKTLESHANLVTPAKFRALKEVGKQFVSAESEINFFLLLRRNAFYKAKLASITFAAAQWDEEDLILALQRLSSEPQFSWYDGDGNGYNFEDFPLFDPWYVFNLYLVRDMRTTSALTKLNSRFDQDLSCGFLFQLSSVEVRKNHILSRYEHDLPAACPFVRNGDQVVEFGDSAAEYERILKILERRGSGLIHEVLLNAMHAYLCFDAPSLRQSSNLRNLCSLWVHEPQETHYLLRYNNLRLKPGKDFERLSVAGTRKLIKAGRNNWADDLSSRLGALTRPGDSKLSKDLTNIQARLHAHLDPEKLPVIWANKDSKSKVIKLYLKTDSELPSQSAGVLLIVTQDKVQLVEIPERFLFQENGFDIVAISDLDKDGDVEIWLHGKMGECDEENSKPGISCALERVFMGEVSNGMLSYFVDNRKTALESQARIELVYKEYLIKERKLERECRKDLINYKYFFKNKKSHQVSLQNAPPVDLAAGKVIKTCRDGTRYIVVSPLTK